MNPSRRRPLSTFSLPFATPFSLPLALAMTVLLAGCASNGGPPANTQFDFGPAGGAAPAAAASAPALAALVVTDATGSAAFDNERMVYRLNYADPLQMRSYANSRWSAVPLQLVTQRIKTRLAQGGMKVLSATDASTGVPLLRMELDDFSHIFDSTTRSQGLVVLRASLFDGHTLLDQRTFERRAAAGSNDAAGGARALAAATDALAADMAAWLSTQRPRK
ncbi:MAG: ABC-type transport auxiliary lipoprotein family protein [Massilia sp.]